MAYSSLSVANAFINLAREEGKSLSNMQLQKLVFFAHGYVLAYLGKELTFDTPKAWTFGPVYPALYNSLRHFGSNGTDQCLPISDMEEVSQQSDEFQIIWNVWQAYKFHSAAQLSRISHNIGSPWSQVWEIDQFGEIPNHITREYYSGLIAK
ncbi:Panacea domain-containing protein [Avibacterium avium]|uniref:Panacea domain-containing protein n=1 Tax=Avibacterium avium TaxID=751 RepID=UPI003BF79E17